MKYSIAALILLTITTAVYGYSINCTYLEGEQVCNGYRLKNQCKNKNVDVMTILTLQYGLNWLNDKAREEYYGTKGCLTHIKDDDSSAIGFNPNMIRVVKDSYGSTANEETIKVKE